MIDPNLGASNRLFGKTRPQLTRQRQRGDKGDREQHALAYLELASTIPEITILFQLS